MPPEEDGDKGVTSAQAKPDSEASSPPHTNHSAQSQQSAGNEHFVVAVIRLLPDEVRERFCYVCLAAALIALGMGLYLVPQATVAGGSGVALVSLVKRMFGR